MFPGDHEIPPPPPPSISSAPIPTIISDHDPPHAGDSTSVDPHNNNQSFSNVDDSQTGIRTRFPALSEEDNSNDSIEDGATGYHKGGGQPPSTQTTAGGNYIGGGEASESGTSAGEPEKYFQMSMTGKSIGKYKPPPYYLDDEKS